MSLQSKLNSLITSINEITGQSKTDLTSAIQDLADNQPSGSINITENGTYDVSQKASAIVNTPTGLKIPITVSAPTGSTVTCTKGSETLTATEESGTWTFSLPSFGVWTLTATLGTETDTETVTISANTFTMAYATRLRSMELGSTVYLDEGSSSENWIPYHVVEKRTNSNGEIIGVVCFRDQVSDGFAYRGAGGTSTYTLSDVDAFYNSTFQDRFKSAVKNLFVELPIKYTDLEAAGSVADPYIKEVNRKCFIPSRYELYGTYDARYGIDGHAQWNASHMATLAIGIWWRLRSPANNVDYVSSIDASGNFYSYGQSVNINHGAYRPAIFISPYAIVDTDSGNKIQNY